MDRDVFAPGCIDSSEVIRDETEIMDRHPSRNWAACTDTGHKNGAIGRISGFGTVHPHSNSIAVSIFCAFDFADLRIDWGKHTNAQASGPAMRGCQGCRISIAYWNARWLSSRCTMPGRFTPPMPLRSSMANSKALTSVPLSLPAAGCTTMPQGLMTTATSSSS